MNIGYDIVIHDFWKKIQIFHTFARPIYRP